MDVEGCLISRAIDEMDLAPILKAGIKRSFFSNPEHGAVFNWMLLFYEEYGESPGEDALAKEFPDYGLLDSPEPYRYYLDELTDGHRRELLVIATNNVITELGNNDTVEATKAMAIGLENLHLEVTAGGAIVDITQNTAERLAMYLSRRRDETQGVPTGFPSLDALTSGLHPEQLVTLVGLQKEGKSTILLLMAMAAHMSGKRPLFVTFEMSIREQMARHDALRAHVCYDRVMYGGLTEPEQKKLGQMFDDLGRQLPMGFIHDPSSTTTVSALSAQIAQYHPDAVYVDGVYLMESELPNVDAGSPQGLTSITRSMKRLAQRAKLPIVMTTQVLPSKVRKRQGITLDAIGYTSSFAQDSDVIMGVERNKEMPEIMLRVVAARNAPPADIRVSWDWEHGRIEEVDPYGGGYDPDDDDFD
jgi:replicative DNA helicase